VNSTGELLVAPEIWPLFPDMQIVVVVGRWVSISQRLRREMEAHWEEVWHVVGARGGGAAQSHPRVRPWRAKMSALGVSGQKHPSSVEALLRRAINGKPRPQISPVVDLYNSVSLQHIVPVGGFDLGALSGGVQLRLSRPGDRFTPLDSQDPEDVPTHEVCYAVGHDVLTRHFVWKQSRTGLIDERTNEVLLVAEVLGEVIDDDPSLPARVRADLHEGMAAAAEEVSSWILSE
jgi:DNA/RNA-binding domain of Phe-tRNA-synthetase-like protein